MPLKYYGVLKCLPKERKLGSDSQPHYQVLVSDGKQSHRIAINVKSQESPSELLFVVNEDFQHPITKGLGGLPLGFKPLDSKPGGSGLDFIRGNLFDVSEMKPLPLNVTGPDNDLDDLLEKYISRAIKTPDAVLYAFGQKWGPENNKPDKYFNFTPGNGIHDIHMNQGNSEKFKRDDGVWQDGGLLINFPSKKQWVAIFLAFQSQSFHTDDRTGHTIDNLQITQTSAGVRIVAALVNPPGEDPSKETVTLINTSPEQVDLNGWAIADSLKRQHPLHDITLAPGAFVTVPLSGDDIQLPNEGGIITLLDPQGIKIHGVSFTKEDAKNQGWTVVF